MITDRKQIRAEAERVLSQEMYVPLTEEHFAGLCPECNVAIRVTARDVARAVRMFEIELAAASHLAFAGMVLFVQCPSLTMGGLAHIKSLLPCGVRSRTGLSSRMPEGGEIEICLFAEAVSENDRTPV